MEPEVPLPFLTKPATCSCLQPDTPHTIHSISLKTILILSFHQCQCLQSGLLPSSLPTPAHILSATCPPPRHTNNICRHAQVTQPLLTLFTQPSAASSDVQKSATHPVPGHLQPVLTTQGHNQCSPHKDTINAHHTRTISAHHTRTQSMLTTQGHNRCSPHKGTISAHHRRTRSVLTTEGHDRCSPQNDTVGAHHRRTQSVFTTEGHDRCSPQNDTVGAHHRRTQSVFATEGHSRCSPQNDTVSPHHRMTQSVLTTE